MFFPSSNLAYTHKLASDTNCDRKVDSRDEQIKFKSQE
jgi:hypothetical protein